MLVRSLVVSQRESGENEEKLYEVGGEVVSANRGAEVVDVSELWIVWIFV